MCAVAMSVSVKDRLSVALLSNFEQYRLHASYIDTSKLIWHNAVVVGRTLPLFGLELRGT